MRRHVADVLKLSVNWKLNSKPRFELLQVRPDTGKTDGNLRHAHWARMHLRSKDACMHVHIHWS